MIYSDYILKAKELVITYDEDAKVSYLEPEWQSILHANGLGNLDEITDMCIDGWYDLEDVLKLEVDRRNAVASKINIILDWIYNVITTTVDPAILKDETDLMESMVELARVKNQQQPKDTKAKDE